MGLAYVVMKTAVSMWFAALPWWHRHQSSRVGLLLRLTIPFLVQIGLISWLSILLELEHHDTMSQQLAFQIRQQIALRAWQVVAAKGQQLAKIAPKAKLDALTPKISVKANTAKVLPQLLPEFQDLSADLQFRDHGSVIVFDPQRFNVNKSGTKLDPTDSKDHDLTMVLINYVQQQLPNLDQNLDQIQHQNYFARNFIFERDQRKYYVVVSPYIAPSHGLNRFNLNSPSSVNLNESLKQLLVLVIMPEDDFLIAAHRPKLSLLWLFSLLLSLLWIWLVTHWLLKTMTQITLDCQQIKEQIMAANLHSHPIKSWHFKKTKLPSNMLTKSLPKDWRFNKRKANLRQSHLVPLVSMGKAKKFKPIMALINQSSLNPAHDLATDWHHAINQMQDKLNILYYEINAISQQLMLARQESIAMQSWLKADSVRAGAEIKIARQIQKMLLPSQAEMTINGLDIAAYMQPMDAIGGDYYDVLQTPQGVTVSMGDVTGHGLESGILMLMTQTAVRTWTESNQSDIKEFFNAINRTICHNVKRMNSDKCLSLTVFNYDQGKLTISGQHEDILVVRHNGIIELIDTFDLGFPIGLELNISQFIKCISIELQPGDGVVLYTDGITEAQNPQKEFYGIAPLCNLVQKHWHSSAHEIQQVVIADLAKYIGNQKIMDDITLLVFKRKI